MTRPDPKYFRAALKSAAREALWLATCDHRPGSRPDVMLFATRRGGSTFAMEVIAANRGVRSLNQPFSLLSSAATAAQVADLPRFYQGQITSLDPVSEDRLQRYTQRLLEGRAVVNAPVRPWRRDVERRSDRLVLKIVDAKPVIDWFDHRFECSIVYLTRHPIPQSLSCIRNGWTLTVEAHLGDNAFVSSHLDDRALALAHDTMRNGSELRRFVLNWALENVAPARLLPDRPAWLHVRYEDCVVDPRRTLERLAERLELVDEERMNAVLKRPSVSSGRSTEQTRSDIAAGQGAEVVNRWRDRVDVDDIRWCRTTLETFGIDAGIIEL